MKALRPESLFHGTGAFLQTDDGVVGRGLRVEGWSVGSIQIGFAIKTRDLGSSTIIAILDHVGRVFSDFLL